jgi:hypothetical protein
MRLIDEDEANFNARVKISSKLILNESDNLVARVLIQTINKMLPTYLNKFKTFPRRFFQLFGIDQFFYRNGTSAAYEVNGKSSLIEANVNLD